MIEHLSSYTDEQLQDHLAAIRARLGAPVDGIDDQTRKLLRSALKRCMQLPSAQAKRKMIRKAAVLLDDTSRPVLAAILADVGIPG